MILLCFLLKDGIIKCTVLTDLKSFFFVQFSIEQYHLRSEKIMYKYTDNTQSNFLDFNQPIGLHMNPENRWVKMADAIPWKVFEKKYSRLFKGKNGRVAKPLRLALGSLIIKRNISILTENSLNS